MASKVTAWRCSTRGARSAGKNPVYLAACLGRRPLVQVPARHHYEAARERMTSSETVPMGASLSVHQEAGLLGKARVRAGDRAPDVVFLDSRTGAQTSLFAPLGRSRFVALLGPGYNPAGAGARPAPKTGRLVEDLGRLGVECSVVLPGSARSGDGLIDATGDFRRLYGARGEFLYLIRPDGYVGLFQRPIDGRAAGLHGEALRSGRRRCRVRRTSGEDPRESRVTVSGLSGTTSRMLSEARMRTLDIKQTLSIPPGLAAPAAPANAPAMNRGVLYVLHISDPFRVSFPIIRYQER